MLSIVLDVDFYDVLKLNAVDGKSGDQESCSIIGIEVGNHHFVFVSRVLITWELVSGPLPFTANVLQNLDYLDLSFNSLNGSIPSWMLSPLLILLSLGRNCFSGPLPKFKTNSLEWPYLFQNQLYGLITQSFKDLVNLTNANLEQNKLSGEIVAEMLPSMTNLSTFVIFLIVVYHGVATRKI
ncbi:hypothetical protein RDI58_007556 [Solanum bulbocastanum]|uniref:Non-specific serine/threonine protein kinase n=1 Tax=Solanum bulbocastanum TaxID=147425 RepID=A0AAN8TT19_SOLBU